MHSSIRRRKHAYRADILRESAAGVVFDYLTNPSNLADWQTSKTSVEPLTDGAPRLIGAGPDLVLIPVGTVIGAGGRL